MGYLFISVNRIVIREIFVRRKWPQALVRLRWCARDPFVLRAVVFYGFRCVATFRWPVQPRQVFVGRLDGWSWLVLRSLSAGCRYGYIRYGINCHIVIHDAITPRLVGT